MLNDYVIKQGLDKIKLQYSELEERITNLMNNNMNNNIYDIFPPSSRVENNTNNKSNKPTKPTRPDNYVDLDETLPANSKEAMTAQITHHGLLNKLMIGDYEEFQTSLESTWNLACGEYEGHSRLVIVGEEGVYSDDNGKTWQPSTGNSRYWNVAFGNNMYVISTSYDVKYSKSGTGFRYATVNVSGHVAFGAGTFMLVGNYYGKDGEGSRCVYSYDGIHWEYGGFVPDYDDGETGCSNDTFIAFGRNYVSWSKDCIEWVAVPLQNTYYESQVRYNDGVFTVYDRRGEHMAYSTNGKVWVEDTNKPTENNIGNFRYIDGWFVVMDATTQKHYRSEDCKNWEEINIPRLDYMVDNKLDNMVIINSGKTVINVKLN